MQPTFVPFPPTVYTLIAGWYQEHIAPHKPRRCGAKPKVSDSEVLTLMVLHQFLAPWSERRFLRFVHEHWPQWFPVPLSQSAYNRRTRDLGNVMAQLIPWLDEQVSALCGPPAYELLDGVPVPLMQRLRGGKHRLFADEAAIGRGGVSKDWYYGMRALVSVSQHGTVRGFVVGNASTDERWLAEALFRWRADPTAPAPRLEELAERLGDLHTGKPRLGPTGPISSRWGVGHPAQAPMLADLGFRGQAWYAWWREQYHLPLLTKDAYAGLPSAARARLEHHLCSLRQQVETVFAWATRSFGLKSLGARSGWGAVTRIAAKLAAHNLQVWYNYQTGQAPFHQLDLLAA